MAEFNFVFYGGALITKPQLVLCFVSFTSSDAQGPLVYNYSHNTRCNLIDMMDDIVDSAYIDKLSSEYSPPGFPPIERGSVIATANLSMTLPSSAPNTIGPVVSDADLRTLLNNVIDNGQVPAPSPNTLYFLYTPSQVVVSLKGEFSVSDFGGYHDHTQSSTGAIIWYAVVTGTSNGENVEVLTQYSSHELASAMTNPELGVRGWVDKGRGKEISDPCQPSPRYFHGWLLNPFWLRSAGTCGMPAEDGQKKTTVVELQTSANCFGGIAEGSVVQISAKMKRGKYTTPIQSYSWTADNIVLGNPASQHIHVLAPSAGNDLYVSLAATDKWGCGVIGSINIPVVSLGEYEWQIRFCRLISRIRTYARPNRFVDPLWDPLRNLVANPIVRRDLDEIRILHRELETFIHEWDEVTDENCRPRRELDR